MGVSSDSPAGSRLLPEDMEPVGVLPAPSGITIYARPKRASARCPLCTKHSSKAHSRYERTIADLPWRNVCVTLRIRARRFFCLNRRCERVIFCERLREIGPYARKTERLEEMLISIAFELGGEAGPVLLASWGCWLVPMPW